jgi:hypothetical protein
LTNHQGILVCCKLQNSQLNAPAAATAALSLLPPQWDCLSCTHCIVMEVATTAAFFVSFWYW